MNNWQIGFNIVQLLLTFIVWWSSRNKVTNDRFIQLENSKIKLEGELKHLKLDLAKHKPACDNHARMEGNDRELFAKINAVHVMVGEINGGMKAVRNLTDTMNRFLIEQGDKK